MPARRVDLRGPELRDPQGVIRAMTRPSRVLCLRALATLAALLALEGCDWFRTEVLGEGIFAPPDAAAAGPVTDAGRE